jgi:hypothetical protein
MNITSAKYIIGLDGQPGGISATINGEEWSVPVVAGNRHYDEIMRQVEAGTLTIEEAAQ